MIHSPAGIVAARAAIRATMSACDAASATSTSGYVNAPKCSRCGWVSIRPGSTVAPRRSTISAPAPATLRIDPASPDPTTVPSRTTSAATGSPSHEVRTRPFRKSVAGGISIVAAEETRDDEALHLGGTLADLEQALIAVEARHRVLFHQAVAAEDLHRGVRHPSHDLGRPELRHRRLFAEGATLIAQPACLVEQVARRLDLGRHVGELEGVRLKMADRLAELRALFGVRERRFVRALRAAEAHRRDRKAAAVEGLQHLLEAGAALAEEVLARHGDVVEVELGRVRRPPDHLPVHAARREAGGLLLDDDAAVFLAAVGERAGHALDRRAGGDRGRGIGDEDLAAVDDPTVALEARRRLGAAGVGAGRRLRETEPPEVRPAAQ